jgi:hypothetical protein
MVAAPMKAKQVSRIAVRGKFAKSVNKKAALKKREEIEEEAEEEVEAPLKRPAAAAVSRKALKRPAAAAMEEEDEADSAATAKKNKKSDKTEASSKKGKVSGKAAEEQAIAERTKELKAMTVPDLKELVISKGLDKGLKNDMIEAVLAVEVKEREAAKAQAAKVKEVETNIKKDIDSKSRPELAELCSEKGLKKGGPKADLVDRLFEKAKEDGEVQKILASLESDERKETLLSMEKLDLQKLCSKAGVDFLVKEVMVDRLLAAEASARQV